MNFVTLSPERLPKGFRFPKALYDFCSANPPIDLYPWYVFDDQAIVDTWHDIVREWYPTRNLIPFARNDILGDDIACFDGDDASGEPKVYFLHTFASAGWEDRGEVAGFAEWVKHVEPDHAAYLVQKAEDEAYDAKLAEAEAVKKDVGA
jgi:hypothetical protein